MVLKEQTLLLLDEECILGYTGSWINAGCLQLYANP